MDPVSIEISCSNPYIRYFGRRDRTDAGNHIGYWGGAYFMANFNGISASIILTRPVDQLPENVLPYAWLTGESLKSGHTQIANSRISLVDRYGYTDLEQTTRRPVFQEPCL